MSEFRNSEDEDYGCMLYMCKGRLIGQLDKTLDHKFEDKDLISVEKYAKKFRKVYVDVIICEEGVKIVNANDDISCSNILYNFLYKNIYLYDVLPSKPNIIIFNFQKNIISSNTFLILKIKFDENNLDDILTSFHTNMLSKLYEVTKSNFECNNLKNTKYWLKNKINNELGKIFC